MQAKKLIKVLRYYNDMLLLKTFQVILSLSRTFFYTNKLRNLVGKIDDHVFLVASASVYDMLLIFSTYFVVKYFTLRSFLNYITKIVTLC